MTTIIPTRTARRIATTQRSHPLVRVLAWELRRFSASRLFWVQTLGFWGFLLFLIWALHASHQTATVVGSEQLSAYVAGTSAGGLLLTLPTYLIILALLLPFITADGVTQDGNRRTHEFLLTTALRTWAYVWGRYLASLVMSLGLALLLLASLLGMGGLLHLTDATYPLPHPDAVLLLWVGMVVPATLLVSSVGFAASTMFPHLSTLVKVGILAAWIVGALVIPLGLGNTTTPPAWYVNWDLTSGVTALGLRPAYVMNLMQLSPTITSEAQLQQLVLSIESKLPDLSGWFVPHLLLGGCSLLLVLVAALAFKRSRETLNP